MKYLTIRRFEMLEFNFSKFFAIVLAMLVLLTGCDKVFSQSVGVCISAYNEYDRDIHRYWLDSENKSGCFGNPPGREPGRNYGGGGGFACGCTLTPGSTVNLYWRFERTLDEYERKIPPEEHEIAVTIPELDGSYPRYFRVYFMRDGNPKLQWVKSTAVPTFPPSQKNEVVE